MISLSLVVDRLPDGTWSALAPWLDEPVTGATFEAVYWSALRRSR